MCTQGPRRRLRTLIVGEWGDESSIVSVGNTAGLIWKALMCLSQAWQWHQLSQQFNQTRKPSASIQSTSSIITLKNTFMLFIHHLLFDVLFDVKLGSLVLKFVKGFEGRNWGFCDCTQLFRPFFWFSFDNCYIISTKYLSPSDGLFCLLSLMTQLM